MIYIFCPVELNDGQGRDFLCIAPSSLLRGVFLREITVRSHLNFLNTSFSSPPLLNHSSYASVALYPQTSSHSSISPWVTPVPNNLPRKREERERSFILPCPSLVGLFYDIVICGAGNNSRPGCAL